MKSEPEINDQYYKRQLLILIFIALIWVGVVYNPLVLIGIVVGASTFHTMSDFSHWVFPDATKPNNK